MFLSIRRKDILVSYAVSYDIKNYVQRKSSILNCNLHLSKIKIHKIQNIWTCQLHFRIHICFIIIVSAYRRLICLI